MLITELGFDVPKQKANVVIFTQANRRSSLHVPHIGGQSADCTDGLEHMADVSLHTVPVGHVSTGPTIVPIRHFQVTSNGV